MNKSEADIFLLINYKKVRKAGISIDSLASIQQLLERITGLMVVINQISKGEHQVFFRKNITEKQIADAWKVIEILSKITGIAFLAFEEEKEESANAN